MAETMKLEIVTPEAIVYSKDVEMVTLPCVEGEIGVLPQHINLMTRLLPGAMTIQINGNDEFLAVGEGLVEVSAKRVAIITTMAIPADKIDETKIEEARQRAEARLKEKLSEEEIASVNASLVHALSQLRIKRRHQ